MFVEFEMLVDRVPRNMLFSVLRSYGVTGSLLESTGSFYSKSSRAVRGRWCHTVLVRKK